MKKKCLWQLYGRLQPALSNFTVVHDPHLPKLDVVAKEGQILLQITLHMMSSVPSKMATGHRLELIKMNMGVFSWENVFRPGQKA